MVNVGTIIGERQRGFGNSIFRVGDTVDELKAHNGRDVCQRGKGRGRIDKVEIGADTTATIICEVCGQLVTESS